MAPDSPWRNMPDSRVFEWLGVDSKHVPYYLHPLNLKWSAEGVDHDLQIFRRVAGLLALDPGYWAEIIRSSWRHSLAGCTCLLASQRCDFFPDLCFRLEARSFVSPQIAVTLGLLHGERACSFLASELDKHEFRRHPKEAVAAHCVLLRLGQRPAYDISPGAWSGFEHDDAVIAEMAVAKHWEFWSSRINPVNH
jgi:hypothetical protein